MDQDSTQEINRQFALLQEEMRRVMSEPQRDAAVVRADEAPADDGAPEDDAAQLRRIEAGLEALRRDADRLRARMARAAEDSATGQAIAALRERIEEVSRASADLAHRVDDNASRLGMATQVHREAIHDLSSQVEALTHRRPSRWPLALAVLVGAAMIAALLPGAPDRVQQQVDRIAALIHGFAPLASRSESPAPVTPPVASPAASADAPATPSPTAEAVPPPAATPAPASDQPPPTAPSPSSVIAPTASPAAPPVAPLAAADAPPALPAPAPTQASEPPPPASALPSSVTPPATADATPAPPPATETVASAPPPPTRPAAPLGQIVLRAKADTWVAVRNGQGGVLLSRVLRAGETWPVPDQPSLMLSTGNAGGLELLVDGVPAPPLGVTGTVRRDVPLVADLIRAGRTGPAAATAAHPQPAATQPATANR